MASPTTVDSALRSAASIAFHHADCHEERGRTYCKPGDHSHEICKFEAQVCRDVGNAIDRYRLSLLSPRAEAAVAAE